MTVMKRENIVDIISLLFVILFGYAASSKLLDFERFYIQLSKSPILTSFAVWISWLIPAWEILIAAFLIFKKYQLSALYASLSLMVIFSSYIIAILNFSAYIPCSCGGILQNMTWREHLIFNFGFVALGIIGILIYPKDKKIYCAIEGEAENLA